MARIRMAGRIDLFLTLHGHAGELPFCEQFIRAFLRLPDATCADLQAYWRTGGPVVELAEGLDEFFQDGKRKCRAVCLERGHVLRFDARTIAGLLPDRAGHQLALERARAAIVQDLVGHELAHVHQFRLGLKFPTEGRMEEDADGWMELWGFSPYSIDRWLAGELGLSQPRTAAEIARRRRPGGRYAGAVGAVLCGR